MLRPVMLRGLAAAGLFRRVRTLTLPSDWWGSNAETVDELLAFLADSPKTMADKHYVTPSDKEFFQALDWLREQILVEV